MTITQIGPDAVTINCDGCGKGAPANLFQSDWTVIGDGEYCEDCWSFWYDRDTKTSTKLAMPVGWEK